MASEPPVARGVLDRATADAHRLWVLRGRRGPGGLDVVGFDARNLRLDGERIIGARLESVDLRGANLAYTDISYGVLRACDFTQAQISSFKLLGATVESCMFRHTRAVLIDFKNAVLRDCAFDGSDLDKSRWQDATAGRIEFCGVEFGNSLFDGGVFTHCDFRMARFRPVTRLPPISMIGAVFEGCDFRHADFTGCDLSGATFRDCRFGDVHGTPAAAAGLTVTGADFSAAGDGSDPGSVDRLLDELGGSGQR